MKSVLHVPSLKDEEELENDGGGCGIRVELTGTCHQHGPRHPTQVPQCIGVYSTTCGRNWSKTPPQSEQFSDTQHDTVTMYLLENLSIICHTQYCGSGEK